MDLNEAFCTITAFPREKLLGIDFRDLKGKKMLEYLYDEGYGLADALEMKKAVHAHAAFVAAKMGPTLSTGILSRSLMKKGR